jgi:hypothetical protein
MITNRVIAPLICAMVLLVIFSSSIGPTGADEINPGLYSPNSSPYNVPYKEWIAKWWQWNYNFPNATHPREYYSTERCDQNQNGPVWFLPDSAEGSHERQCTIPTGKAILVPLATGIWHNDGTERITDSDLPRLAKNCNNGAIFGSTNIDGKRLKDLEKYRSETGFFKLNVKKDNYFGALKEGTWTAYADGYFLFIEPLPQGQHTIVLDTNVINTDEPPQVACNYQTTLTYRVLIK